MNLDHWESSLGNSLLQNPNSFHFYEFFDSTLDPSQIQNGNRALSRGHAAGTGQRRGERMPDKRGIEMVAEATDAADERPYALVSGQVLQPAHTVCPFYGYALEI